jgi:hypothetical protein
VSRWSSCGAPTRSPPQWARPKVRSRSSWPGRCRWPPRSHARSRAPRLRPSCSWTPPPTGWRCWPLGRRRPTARAPPRRSNRAAPTPWPRARGGSW